MPSVRDCFTNTLSTTCKLPHRVTLPASLQDSTITCSPHKFYFLCCFLPVLKHRAAIWKNNQLVKHLDNIQVLLSVTSLVTWATSSEKKCSPRSLWDLAVVAWKRQVGFLSFVVFLKHAPLLSSLRSHLHPSTARQALKALTGRSD